MKGWKNRKTKDLHQRGEQKSHGVALALKMERNTQGGIRGG